MRVGRRLRRLVVVDAAADAAPTTITVFAAASLTEAFDTLAAQFEAEHPNVDVVLSYGGSAALAQQIVEGAPVDVFASAAEPPMQTVADAGLAVDPVVFATNTLELAVPAGNPAGVVGPRRPREPRPADRALRPVGAVRRGIRGAARPGGRRPRRPTRSSPT